MQHKVEKGLRDGEPGGEEAAKMPSRQRSHQRRQLRLALHTDTMERLQLFHSMIIGCKTVGTSFFEGTSMESQLIMLARFHYKWFTEGKEK